MKSEYACPAHEVRDLSCAVCQRDYEIEAQRQPFVLFGFHLERIDENEWKLEMERLEVFMDRNAPERGERPSAWVRIWIDDEQRVAKIFYGDDAEICSQAEQWLRLLAKGLDALTSYKTAGEYASERAALSTPETPAREGAGEDEDGARRMFEHAFPAKPGGWDGLSDDMRRWYWQAFLFARGIGRAEKDADAAEALRISSEYGREMKHERDMLTIHLGNAKSECDRLRPENKELKEKLAAAEAQKASELLAAVMGNESDSVTQAYRRKAVEAEERAEKAEARIAAWAPVLSYMLGPADPMDDGTEYRVQVCKLLDAIPEHLRPEVKP